jgi:hypothetical protein
VDALEALARFVAVNIEVVDGCNCILVHQVDGGLLMLILSFLITVPGLDTGYNLSVVFLLSEPPLFDLRSVLRLPGFDGSISGVEPLLGTHTPKFAISDVHLTICLF